jgi:hypothetical protein
MFFIIITKNNYPTGILFKNNCKEFEHCIQHSISIPSGYKDVGDRNIAHTFVLDLNVSSSFDCDTEGA